MISVASAINSLPCNEKELVALLRQEGIRGSRQDCYNCPVAVYIRQKSKIPVRVTPKTIGWSIPAAGFPGDFLTVSVDSTDAIRDFIFNFDHGGYSDLLLVLSDTSSPVISLFPKG